MVAITTVCIADQPTGAHRIDKPIGAAHPSSAAAVAPENSQIHHDEGTPKTGGGRHGVAVLDDVRVIQGLQSSPESYRQPQLAEKYLESAHAFYRNGNIQDARVLFADIAKNAQDPILVADALRMVGQSARFLQLDDEKVYKNYTSYLEYVQQLDSASYGIRKTMWLADAYAKRSAALQRLERYEDAINDRKRLIDLPLIKGDQYLIGYAYVENARDNARLGRFGEANSNYQSAVTEIQRTAQGFPSKMYDAESIALEKTLMLIRSDIRTNEIKKEIVDCVINNKNHKSYASMRAKHEMATKSPGLLGHKDNKFAALRSLLDELVEMYSVDFAAVDHRIDNIYFDVSTSVAIELFGGSIEDNNESLEIMQQFVRHLPSHELGVDIIITDTSFTARFVPRAVDSDD